ncbi:hypothetical protein FNV43_RR26414 [Rhamnella rubrinervis]|uniref:Uncharacterized protein n=1 Tax=Rhamnella rubrinervis TaxID=2594499 RepID=A0A8K0GJL7_9ROSA|nr:hypothetical protein FNV43_RR26414 [Rhamnella rubrinervis]
MGKGVQAVPLDMAKTDLDALDGVSFESERKNFGDLENFTDFIDQPWVVIRDFNAILGAHERFGGGPPIFSSDYDFRGGRETEGFTEERLARNLAARVLLDETTFLRNYAWDRLIRGSGEHEGWQASCHLGLLRVTLGPIWMHELGSFMFENLMEASKYLGLDLWTTTIVAYYSIIWFVRESRAFCELLGAIIAIECVRDLVGSLMFNKDDDQCFDKVRGNVTFDPYRPVLDEVARQYVHFMDTSTDD